MTDHLVTTAPSNVVVQQVQRRDQLVTSAPAKALIQREAPHDRVVVQTGSAAPLVQQVARRDVVSRDGADQFIYRQGGSTGSGASGDSLHVPPINFSYGDAAHAIFTAAIGCTLTQLSVVIDTPFNGGGAALQMNVGATVVLPPSDVDPARALEYQVAPALQLIAGDSIFFSITPGSGATTGAGRIFIELQ